MTYEPKGMVFWSQGKNMMLVSDEEPRESLQRWLLYRHPDGHWVTLRKATGADIEAIFSADVENGRVIVHQLPSAIMDLMYLDPKERMPIDGVDGIESNRRIQEAYRRGMNEVCAIVGPRTADCCKNPDHCGGECTCEICAPHLALRDLKARIETLIGVTCSRCEKGDPLFVEPDTGFYTHCLGGNYCSSHKLHSLLDTEASQKARKRKSEE